jgi:hypothetical protein
VRINILNTIAGSLLLFGVSGAAVGQTAPQQKAGIVDLQPYAIVSVEFYVRAADKQLVVPVCSDEEDKEPVLCAARVQRFNGKKWYGARPRRRETVLGMYAKEYWKPVVILPGKEKVFHFAIDRDFFGIREGERLRIVLDVWSSTESMAKETYIPDSQFVSPVFVCP